ncbi:MAG: acyl-CoA dehydrogenase family protein [Bacteroidota bacterium]
MNNHIFTEEHNLFRESLREFLQKEVVPNINSWEKEKTIPKSIWKKMGDMGYLGLMYPEKYGGMELDFLYSLIYLEETAKVGSAGFAASAGVQSYMAFAHLYEAGSELLKQKYIPGAISGDKLGALGITEPGAGSDVMSIRTSASDMGDHYLVNGSKIFITNGYQGDFITLAVKTDPNAGINGISLIVVDLDADGVSRTKLEKIGYHSSATAEIFFEDVKVPKENLIGDEGHGFFYVMESFQLERLMASIGNVAACEYTIDITLQYMKERNVFGRPINKFQVLRHRITDLYADVEMAKTYIYQIAQAFDRKEYLVKECTIAKMKTSELAKKVADECLQMFGGFGYMDDYEISRIYRDARVSTIVGGTTEIMAEILAKIVVDDTMYRSTYKGEAKHEVKAEIEEEFSEKPEKAIDIIRSLANRVRKEKAHGYSTVFHFDISGDNGGEFTVSLKDGICRVKDGLEGEADCKVKAKDKIYEELELGKRNPEMAVMTGKIKISNLAEMMKFTKMFKRLF